MSFASDAGYGVSDPNNTSTTPLTGSATFTGTATLNTQPDVMCSCYSDTAGTLYFDFSVNGTDWRTFPSAGFSVAAGIHEFHVAVKGPRYFRVRFVNGSSAQTTFQLYTYYGIFRQGNSPLNQTQSLDSDAIITKTFESELSVAFGLFSGVTKVNKLGKNNDIDTGTVPEDVWDSGGTYTGFPTGSPETVSLVSTSASDTGTVRFIGLKTSTSTSYESETVTLTGTTPVTSVDSWYRIHTAFYNDSSATTLNAGDITINHSTTTANVFLKILAGRSQSNTCAYTIPMGHTGFIRKLTGAIRKGGSSTYADGALWIRTTGNSPRLRRPFTITSNEQLDQDIYGGVRLAEGTDVIPRIIEVGANNLDIVFGMDIIIIQNQ